jgi:hypothetical protein
MYDLFSLIVVVYNFNKSLNNKTNNNFYCTYKNNNYNYNVFLHYRQNYIKTVIKNSIKKFENKYLDPNHNINNIVINALTSKISIKELLNNRFNYSNKLCSIIFS